MSGYIYDAGWEKERERLRGLEAAADPATRAAFTTVGVASGWRCLEVGPGAGSMVRALAGLVGTEGKVVAVDLDTRFVEELAGPNVDVRQLDITCDPVPGGPFDLVHARALLEHLPERDAVLGRLAGLLRPGGWLVVEDVDFMLGVYGDAQQVAAPSADASRRLAKLWRANTEFMRGKGIDPEYGRWLPMRFADLGLEGVQASAAAHVMTPDSASFPVVRWSLEHLRIPLIEQGLLTDADAQALYEDLQRPVSSWSPLFVTAWGRKPL
ncbi:MAG TPA: methyltransferase domain-containing protein [Egibacteraceae bacterium]|nr:methyltransferase domain-containing protein [Egibacteraceae bacterium]